VTTIRPSPFQQTPLHTGQRDDAGKLSAQRAFFAAAMAQAQAPAATAAPAAPQAAPATHMATTPAEAPQKVLRPGSLLDIRV